MSDEKELALPGDAEAPKTEARSFTPEEMITCGKCLRANAPTRDTCMYCSAELPRDAFATLPTSEARALAALGVTGEVKPDEEPPPRRIRSLEFRDELVVASPAGAREKLSARWDDFVLLVTARLIVNRLEVEQPKSLRNKKPADRRQLSSDDTVFDLYTKSRDGGWRVAASSFDFSCLGPEKSALAAENFVTLMDTIRSRATNAVFDDAYAKTRRALDEVWPVEQRTESQSWKRGGAGKFSMTTATVHDNEPQFTRYSQLRHYLRLQDLNQSE